MPEASAVTPRTSTRDRANDGVSPDSSGRTHICTNRVGSAAPGASLRSLCRTPEPADSRCT